MNQPQPDFAFIAGAQVLLLRVPTVGREIGEDLRVHTIHRSTATRLAGELAKCLGDHPHDWCRRERETLWDAVKTAEAALRLIHISSREHHISTEAARCLLYIQGALQRVKEGVS